MSLAMIRFRVV